MSTIQFGGKARLGIHRAGQCVTLTFQFPTEYDAIAAYEVWTSKDEITIQFTGPRAASEQDALAGGAHPHSD